MSRYRPPSTPGSKYITAQGEKVLRDELHFLWKVKRPEVTQAVSDAAKQGDRSENAEYIYGKKQLREIDSRVRFLTKRLENMIVVKTTPDDISKVYFGAWVSLENDEGVINRYRLVGPDEIDMSRGYLSIDSPMGRAILGKRVDDEVVVRVGEAERFYDIVKVEYD